MPTAGLSRAPHAARPSPPAPPARPRGAAMPPLPTLRRSVAASAGGSTTYGTTPSIKGSEYIVLVRGVWREERERGCALRGAKTR